MHRWKVIFGRAGLWVSGGGTSSIQPSPAMPQGVSFEPSDYIGWLHCLDGRCVVTAGQNRGGCISPAAAIFRVEDVSPTEEHEALYRRWLRLRVEVCCHNPRSMPHPCPSQNPRCTLPPPPVPPLPPRTVHASH